MVEEVGRYRDGCDQEGLGEKDREADEFDQQRHAEERAAEAEEVNRVELGETAQPGRVRGAEDEVAIERVDDQRGAEVRRRGDREVRDRVVQEVPAEPEQAEVQDVCAGADDQVADPVVTGDLGNKARGGLGVELGDANGRALSVQWNNHDGTASPASVSAEGPAVFVSVVVPCYRSAATLPRLVENLTQVLPEVTSGYEIVLVVDGSPDDTWQVASELANKYSETRAMRLARNYGQHNALIAGVRNARYEVVVTMDDDLQHPADQVPALLRALTDDIDLVYGVPADEEHGFFRSLSSRMVKAAMSTTLSVKGAKSISAFRAFRTFLRDGFDGLDGPHASVDVALSWSTTRIAQTTVRMEDRAEGKSNYSTWMLIKHALTLITGYSTEPLRLVGYLGFICAVFGVGLFGVIIYKYAAGATTVAGFTTIASMVALFSGAQMLALGVLGEYVGRLHSGSMGRPTYVIRERTDVDAHPDITSESD